MFTSILLGSFCLIALSACGGTNDSLAPQNEKITIKEQVFQKLEDEGKLPKLEKLWKKELSNRDIFSLADINIKDLK